MAQHLYFKYTQQIHESMNRMISQLNYSLKALKAGRLYSVISITGLALGLVCMLVIAKYVYQEYTTDYSHRNYDRIYVCASKDSPVSKPRLSKDWRHKTSRSLSEFDHCPEVEAYTSLQMYDRADFTYNNKIYYGTLLTADSNFYKVFDFPMITGDLKTILTRPDHIVLTESMAERVCRQKNPVGEQVAYQGSMYTVAGIFKNPSVNSSFSFDALILPQMGRMPVQFIVLKEGMTIDAINRTSVGQNDDRVTYEYIPFRTLYFNDGLNKDLLPTLRTGNLHTLTILLIVGIVILVISLFNYVNIYNVMLLKRGRELGVKKVYGADGSDLWRTFISENFIITFTVTALAVVLIYCLSGWMETKIGITMMLNLRFDGCLLAGILILLPLCISLPPFFRYRAIHPVMAIRKEYSGRDVSISRRVLLALQYIMTTAMIVVSLYFMKQLNFMLDREIGLKQENIIHVNFFSWLDNDVLRADTEKWREYITSHMSNIQYVENELENNPFLKYWCNGESPLKASFLPWKYMKGTADYTSCFSLMVTPGFDSLYGLEVKEGRFFDYEKDQDRQHKVVLNETAKKFFGITSLEDTFLANNYWGQEKKPWQVIGVVKDFRFKHLSKAIEPLVFLFFDDKEEVPYMMHITKGKEKESLVFLETLYRKVNPNSDFSYRFFADEIKAQYDADKKLVKIFSFFTLIAVFISSIGLFGFSVFDVQQRYKEIGIRRVNGAEIREIILLLTLRFLVLVGVSFLIACPLAFFAIKKYMEYFSECTPLSWWLFGVAALFSGLIAFVTLFWQSYRAATANPVESIKSE